MSIRFSRLVLGFVFFASPVFALVERRVERRFEVPPAAFLKVDTFSGAVHISQGEADVIEVTVIETADVEKEAAMDARLKDLDLRLERKEAGVAVVARYRERFIWSWKTWPPLQLSYEIKVPPGCDLAVRTIDGGIRLDSFRGKADLANDSGPIFTGEIVGHLQARSRLGDIEVTACTGALTAHSRSGNITVGRAFGRTELSSDGGYIELQRAAGEVVVRGSGTDAMVGLVAPVKNPARITTSGGDISLVLENTAACTLDLHASVFGRVKIRDLAVAVTAGGPGRSELAGAVNGGGPLIFADAHGGNILVRGLDAVATNAPAGSALPPQK